MTVSTDCQLTNSEITLESTNPRGWLIKIRLIEVLKSTLSVGGTIPGGGAWNEEGREELPGQTMTRCFRLLLHAVSTMMSQSKPFLP